MPGGESTPGGRSGTLSERMPSPFHADLRVAAMFLPRGVGAPWIVRMMRRMPIPAGKLPAGLTLTERRFGAAGIRVIGAPVDGTPRPAMLWIHGGGYVIGAAQQDDGICARFAERLGVVVVSVDYRLAPEHPFPAPLDDCIAAYEYVLTEAHSLGIDTTRLVIAGQSAGGGLAAALVLALQDRGLPLPLLQVLVYPMLDDRTVTRPVDGRVHRVWDQRSNRYGWTSYLGREPGGPAVPDLAAPARREALGGLPPTWIGVGTADLFHDEDLAYARRLREAGVPVELEVVEGAFHGFDAVLPKAGVSRAFFESQAAAIERAVRRS